MQGESFDLVLVVVDVGAAVVVVGVLVRFGPEMAGVRGAAGRQFDEVVQFVVACFAPGDAVGGHDLFLDWFGESLGWSDAGRVAAESADGGVQVGLGDGLVDCAGCAGRIGQQVGVVGSTVVTGVGTVGGAFDA